MWAAPGRSRGSVTAPASSARPTATVGMPGPVYSHDIQATIEASPGGNGWRKRRRRGGPGCGRAVHGNSGVLQRLLREYREPDEGVAETGQGGLDALSGDRQIPVEVCVDAPWVAGHGVVEVQLVGTASKAAYLLQLPDVLAPDVVPGPLDFPVLWGLFRQEPQLVPDDLFNSPPGSARGRP